MRRLVKSYKMQPNFKKKGGYKEKMDMRSRNQYLETLIPRYLKSARKGKTSLLNEYCFNTKRTDLPPIKVPPFE